MTYKEARVYLDELSKYGSVLGLDTIRELLRELGNPQDDLKFIHIAGTNGKGSVLAYTSMILSEAGYRTGRYVSPTVVSYLERIQVDGEWISETEFAELTEKVRDAIARMKTEGKPCPTVFETETAMAFLYFKKCGCDFVVLEAGLGGTGDATNVITETVCAVFSSISMDHIGVIGNTLEEIASDKSGIIKPGCTVISGRQQDEAEQILRDRAEACGAEYFSADPDLAEITEESWNGISFSYKEFKGLISKLCGVYQTDNAVTALEVIRSLRKKGFCIPDEAVKKGMRKTEWPGRFTCLGENPMFIIDGAHNENAAVRLRETLEKYFPGKRPVLIFGVFCDKDYKKIAEILCPSAREIYTVNLPDAVRGLPAEKLADAVRPYCGQVFVPDIEHKEQIREKEGYDRYAVMQVQSVEKAVSAALDKASEEDVILACGSLSWIWQAKEAYERKKGAKNDKS